MATVRDLIKSSLRLIGAAATGDIPSASEMTDGLYALNDLLQSWSTENLFVPAKTREEFDLIAGQSKYTMGPGGDFDTTRPLGVESAAIQENAASPKYELPMSILTVGEFSQITIKDTPSSIPHSIYFEGTSPLETLNIYPVPSETKKLVLYTTKEIANYASINATIDLPPGYARALRYALAIEMCPEYGKEPTMAIMSSAMDAKTAIKRKNIKPQYLKCDAGTLGRAGAFDWRTGGSR